MPFDVSGEVRTSAKHIQHIFTGKIGFGFPHPYCLQTMSLAHFSLVLSVEPERIDFDLGADFDFTYVLP
ncbi:MAG: hypothetical protein ABSA75_14230 [Candidatus Bathyarchaeia archaeon]